MSRDEFADWDAAYVLGSLSSTDRAAYEDHLAHCAECAAAVRALAVLPGLLAKVPPEEVPDAEPVEPLPFDLLARTRAAAQQEAATRRRRRWAVSAVAVAASAAVFAGGVVWSQQADNPSPGVTVAMRQVQANPLSATLHLYDRPWGTAVEMTCTYAASTSWDSRAVYTLYVIDRAGHGSSISTWSAEPGTTSKLTAATAVPRADIAQLQVRGPDGRTLLSATPS